MIDIQNKVTVIVPSRDIDFYLKDCIRKIRELYPAVKIVFIIDEYTEDAVSDFDENIKFLKSENRNMSAKRNLGVKNSDTDYVAFIDSDAYPDKNWLELSIEYLNNNENYAAVTGCQKLPPDNDFDKQCLRIVRFSVPFTYPEWSKVIDLNTKEQDCNEFMTSNLVMRKSDYLFIGGMNENIYLAEDNEFSERVIKNGNKIRFIPEVQVFHHEASFIPFMRKIFSMGYYYSATLINKNYFQGFKKYVIIFLPLSIILILLFLFLNFFSFLNLILFSKICLILLFGLFTILSLKFCKKLKNNKTKSFFYFILIFIGFGVSYITGQILGLLNLKNIRVQNLYRYY